MYIPLPVPIRIHIDKDQERSHTQLVYYPELLTLDLFEMFNKSLIDVLGKVVQNVTG